MWSRFSTFGAASLATALGCCVVLATSILLRHQQIRLFRLGYYRRTLGGLKPLRWRAFVCLLCIFSVAIGAVSPKIGLISLIFGLLLAWGWGHWVTIREALLQQEAMISYLAGLEGLLHGGVAFPSALERLSVSGSHWVHTMVRRAFRRFSGGENFGVVLGSLPPSLALMERAHRLGLPIVPIAQSLRQALETRHHQEKRIGEIRQQAVLSGLVALSLPWIMFVFLCWQQPELFRRMSHSGRFALMVMGSLAFQCAGMGVIWRISKYRDSGANALLDFVQQLLVYLRAGFSLHWSWHSLLDRKVLEWNCFALKSLGSDSESIESCLSRLAVEYVPPDERLWFGVLRELYVEGSNLVPLLEAMALSLRREQERRVKCFAERLPTRVNVVGILFFFPAFFALGILPLLFEIINDLR